MSDPCRFCHQKLVLDNGEYYEWNNEIEIVSGGWTTLYIGVDICGDTVMRACGDGRTRDYYPKYCPECGRSLTDGN